MLRRLYEHGFMSSESSGAGGTGSVRLQFGVRSEGTSLAVPASRRHHLIRGHARAYPRFAAVIPDFALASQHATNIEL